MAFTDVKQIGPEYEAGLDSPTYGKLGIFLKPSTFSKDLQTQLRDDVIAGLTIAVGDRDLNFWKRQSQADWSQGEGQEYFSNVARYSRSSSLDGHTPGQLRLVAQPTRIRKQTVALGGRGGVYCKGNCFFSWEPNFYTWITPGLISNLAATPAGSISDIVSDGVTVYFTSNNWTKVYSTPGAAPINLAAYDTGGFYGRMTWDQLKKILYAVDAPYTGNSKLMKVNAGGAPTTIYDFVTGRLDAVEMHKGNVMIGWNDAFGNMGAAGFAGRGRIFQYDGTNVTVLADFPEGLMILGLESALGILFVMCSEQDPLDVQNSPPNSILSLYAITGSQITRIDTIRAGRVVDSGGGFTYNIGALGMAINVGQHLFLPTSGHAARYDIQLGGVSQSLGDDGIPGLVNTFSAADMNGIALMSVGGILCCINDAGGGLNGGIFNLNGTIFGIRPSSPAAGTAKLTSSRMDAGLPYVSKFLYGWDVISSPLLANESIEMEVSIDDGATWTACAPMVALAAGQTQITFLIKLLNPHARYRVRPVADPGVTKGPYIYSISLRYAVVNPNASVYRMTVSCADTIRGRGNAIDLPGYGKDALDYLDNIARKNELVTFYEPDDSNRTAHSCWVVSVRRPMQNTASVYDPKKKEGEVELVLWEVT